LMPRASGGCALILSAWCSGPVKAGRKRTQLPVENAPPELDYPTERIAALVDRLLRHLEDTLTGEPEPVGAVTAAG
jgi:hypothetical protein